MPDAVDKGAWTPGPLLYRKSGADDFTIYNDMGADLALVLGWPTDDDETDPEAEANARLYAAAPDLAEAASAIIPANLDLGNTNVPDSVFVPLEVTMGELRRLRTALRSAGGRG